MTEHDGAAWEFQLLGQVTAWRDGERVDFGSAHRRAVLALLAVSAGNVVSRDQLVDGLWGDSAPASASGSIYTYVSSLRRSLGDGRGAETGHRVLESVGSGYSLRIPAANVDVNHFETLRGQAQRLCADGDPRAALAALDEALGLWSGTALSGLSGPFAAAQQARLNELRLVSLEQRAELGLVLGRHAEVAADLAPLTRDHPLRETLCGLLMRALHGCGRQAEALAVFADLRETLIQSSGTEPSPALVALHDEIRDADPAQPNGYEPLPAKETTALVPAPAGPPAVSAPRHPPAPHNPPAPHHPLALPPSRAAGFVGRDDALDTLRTLLAKVAEGTGGAVLAQGGAGIGKSALLAEATADAPADTSAGSPRIAWGTADELSPPVRFGLITDCLAAAGHPVPQNPAATEDAAVTEILARVREICAAGPLVLIADNLQWADHASIVAWRHLVRLSGELPLLLVGAYRPLPRRRDIDLVALDLAVRGDTVLELDRLPDPAVYAIVEHMVGAPPGTELRLRADEAAGNPFYVREIVEELVDSGQIVVDGTEAYPACAAGTATRSAVTLRIADHLTVLSGPTREAVRWAALFPSEFTAADLAAAADRPVTEIVEAVDETLLGGYFVENGEWLSFRHPIVRMALYETTPPSMRVVLHRQIAEVLAHAGATVGRVAEQLAAARAPVDPWVLHWLTDNVETVATQAPRVAAGLLRHVVAQSTLPSAERQMLTAVLARILFYLGQDPTTEARLVLSRTEDSQHAAEMRWILAYMDFRHGRRAEAVEQVRRALEDYAVCEEWRGRHLRLRETLSGAQSMPVLAVLRLLDPGPETAGIPATVATSLPVARRRAASHAVPGEIHLASAVHAYWAGRWQEAARAVRTVFPDGQDTASYLLRTPGAVLLVDGLAATIAGHRGEVADARGYLRAATQRPFAQHGDVDFDPDAAGFLMVATAILAEQEGRPEHALDALTPILDPYYPAAVRHQWLPYLTRLAMQVGDRARALHAMHAVQIYGGSAREAYAVLAHCNGIVNQDPDQILAATAYYRVTDFSLHLARGLEDAAATLAGCGRLDEARSSFRSALTAYTRMGAGWDVRRAEERMRRFGIRRAQRVAKSFALAGTA